MDKLLKEILAICFKIVFAEHSLQINAIEHMPNRFSDVYLHQ
jgi:hypothetical protein